MFRLMEGLTPLSNHQKRLTGAGIRAKDVCYIDTILSQIAIDIARCTASCGPTRGFYKGWTVKIETETMQRSWRPENAYA